MTPKTVSENRRQPVKLALNKTTIAGLSPPATGRTYYHDDRVPGLTLCITAGGARTWYLVKWSHGRKARLRLGSTDELTVEQARTMARTLTADIVAGIDVQARKRAVREELTFGELFGRWMEYAREHKRTWPEDQRKYNKFLIHWAGRRLSSIDASDVERLHHSVKVRSGPYQANRVLEMAKAMFKRAIDQRQWKGHNPAATIKKFPEHSRTRFLRPDEMQGFFKALSALPPERQEFFLLLLLTGQRRGAVLAMKWADLDLAAGTWTVGHADSKSGKSLSIPLVPQALDLLRKRSRENGASDFVFPAIKSRSGHLVETKKHWAALVAAAGLHGLRMHDLRRTLGSWLAIQGVSTVVIGAALGHAARIEGHGRLRQAHGWSGQGQHGRGDRGYAGRSQAAEAEVRPMKAHRAKPQPARSQARNGRPKPRRKPTQPAAAPPAATGKPFDLFDALKGGSLRLASSRTAPPPIPEVRAGLAAALETLTPRTASALRDMLRHADHYESWRLPDLGAVIARAEEEVAETLRQVDVSGNDKEIVTVVLAAGALRQAQHAYNAGHLGARPCCSTTPVCIGSCKGLCVTSKAVALAAGSGRNRNKRSGKCGVRKPTSCAIRARKCGSAS